MTRTPVLLLVLTVAVSACGGTTEPEPQRLPAQPADRVVPQRPIADGPQSVEEAPAWVEAFCDDVPKRALCPAKTPPDLQLPATPPERPDGDGYVLQGDATTQWAVISAPDLDAYEPLEPFESTRVRDRTARWLRGREGSGLLAGHLVLKWRERGRTYAVAARGGGPQLSAQIRRVAEGMS